MDNLLYKRIVNILPLFCLFGLLGMAACKNEGQINPDNGEYVINLPKDTSSSEPFYPYIDYLKNQLAYIEATPFSVEKEVTIDGKVVIDSFISREQIPQLAAPFLEINPEEKGMKPFYRENSFADLSIQKLTFSISAIRDDLNLIQADILVNPDNEIVKNIILKKQFSRGDSSVLQYLLWEHNMHFQISETIQKNSGKSYTRITKVIWDRVKQ